jgi:hypothetical protein
MQSPRMILKDLSRDRHLRKTFPETALLMTIFLPCRPGCKAFVMMIILVDYHWQGVVKAVPIQGKGSERSRFWESFWKSSVRSHFLPLAWWQEATALLLERRHPESQHDRRQQRPCVSCVGAWMGDLHCHHFELRSLWKECGTTPPYNTIIEAPGIKNWPTWATTDLILSKNSSISRLATRIPNKEDEPCCRPLQSWVPDGHTFDAAGSVKVLDESMSTYWPQNVSIKNFVSVAVKELLMKHIFSNDPGQQWISRLSTLSVAKHLV